jgi:hypothetical protein
MSMHARQPPCFSPREEANTHAAIEVQNTRNAAAGPVAIQAGGLGREKATQLN